MEKLNNQSHLYLNCHKLISNRVIEFQFNVNNYVFILNKCLIGVTIKNIHDKATKEKRMDKNIASILGELIKKKENEILQEWVNAEINELSLKPNLINEEEFKNESKEKLNLLIEALQNDKNLDIGDANWDSLKNYIERISIERVKKGFTSIETAMFLLSLKEILFLNIKKEITDPSMQGEIFLSISLLLDKLALLALDVYSETREDLIKRQKQTLEFSTPVVEIWEGVLLLPIIGTLDSTRAQQTMETLLEKIAQTGSTVAIIDITGVTTVDTLIAQNLIKTMTAARLMGASCIISGIGPSIAQAITHLGLNLSDIITKATLSDAFAQALTKVGLKIKTIGKEN